MNFQSIALPTELSTHIHLKPTSYLIAISSIGSWMMSFCPYITFTIVSLCQWNTIASYGKCLLVIRRCLKLYPVSMSERCDINLTVIFKSCRALYCLSIPIPFIMPNRLTGAPYLALGNYAIYAYLILSYARSHRFIFYNGIPQIESNHRRRFLIHFGFSSHV